MSPNLLGQCMDVALSFILVLRLVRLRLHLKYLALLAFLSFDCVQSLIYIPFKILHVTLDYRKFSMLVLVITWCTTIWMVYALLTAILQHLPGILRFSLWFLNIIFIAWVALSLLTVKPEYVAFAVKKDAGLLVHLTIISHILDRAFSLAEILVILSILAFVLRFPIRVPRNLAAFSAGLSIYLCFEIAFYLLLTYSPEFRQYKLLASIPAYLLSGCLVYWILTINPTGEEAQVTLGRGWQSVPKEHLVRQLEALNAALLRSREQS